MGILNEGRGGLGSGHSDWRLCSTGTWVRLPTPHGLWDCASPLSLTFLTCGQTEEYPHLLR